MGAVVIGFVLGAVVGMALIVWLCWPYLVLMACLCGYKEDL